MSSESSSATVCLVVRALKLSEPELPSVCNYVMSYFVSESDRAHESPSKGRMPVSQTHAVLVRDPFWAYRAQASENFVGSLAFLVSSAFCENQLICLNSECFSNVYDVHTSLLFYISH